MGFDITSEAVEMNTHTYFSHFKNLTLPIIKECEKIKIQQTNVYKH